jgi:hypothetical protein
MFITVNAHKHVEGEKRPGDHLPDMLKGDVEAALALVRSGYVKWEGPGGEFGPFTTAALKLEGEKKKRLEARLAKIQKTEPVEPKDSEQLSDALSAERARSADLAAKLQAQAAEHASLLARVAALESKAEGSAPAPMAVPSASKGGR